MSKTTDLDVGEKKTAMGKFISTHRRLRDFSAGFNSSIASRKATAGIGCPPPNAPWLLPTSEGGDFTTDTTAAPCEPPLRPRRAPNTSMLYRASRSARTTTQVRERTAPSGGRSLRARLCSRAQQQGSTAGLYNRALQQGSAAGDVRPDPRRRRGAPHLSRRGERKENAPLGGCAQAGADAAPEVHEAVLQRRRPPRGA